MVKKLTRTGNSVALVLDKELLEATGLDAGSTVEVSTDGRVIVISPPADKRRSSKLDAVLGKLTVATVRSSRNSLSEAAALPLARGSAPHPRSPDRAIRRLVRGPRRWPPAVRRRGAPSIIRWWLSPWNAVRNGGRLSVPPRQKPS